MTIDVAGSAQTAIIDERIRYDRDKTVFATYEAAPMRSRLIARRNAVGDVTVRDFVTGVEGTGETYLDALWAFQKARRQRS